MRLSYKLHLSTLLFWYVLFNQRSYISLYRIKYIYMWYKYNFLFVIRQNLIPISKLIRSWTYSYNFFLKIQFYNYNLLNTYIYPMTHLSILLLFYYFNKIFFINCLWFFISIFIFSLITISVSYKHHQRSFKNTYPLLTKNDWFEVNNYFI